MELEIGYGLISARRRQQGGDLLDRNYYGAAPARGGARHSHPAVRIRDNIQLKPNEYRLKSGRLSSGKGELMSGAYLAMDPGTVTKKVRGVATVEPAFGLPALWITESQKEAADMAGYTVWNCPRCLPRTLPKLSSVTRNSLVSRQDVKNLLDSVKENNAAVVEELIPGMLSLGDIHKVLQNLLRERVSIRDLSHISRPGRRRAEKQEHRSAYRICPQWLVRADLRHV